MTRRDEVQLRMEIDGKQAISELGKQELAAYEYRQELKQISEEQKQLEAESKKIDKIGERYDKLTKQIQELEAAGKSNTKEYDRAIGRLGKVSEELRKAEKAQRDLTENQKRYTETSKNLDETKAKISGLRAEMGVAGMTMRQLRQHQRDLAREMDGSVTKGTARYEELKDKLREVNRAINDQKAEVRGSASAWGFLKSEVAKFGVLALGYLGAQEIIGSVQNLVRGSAELSDALSDVQKTTGLTKDETVDLSKTLGDFNTRSARKELLGMAEIAGRLGIQGKKDIEGFVRAADMIQVSLGDSLGDVETVMRDLGKLTSTYNVKEAYGIEESLLRVGSAINELGMASTANEGNIVDFTRRMGGIAPLAKISIQDIMGMGAALDHLGQTSETSSTALSRLFMEMAKNSKAYARFAKMEVNDFVKLMNEDANEAFMKVLEGVKGNSNGITELAGTMGDLGEEGGRVIGVIGTLANQVEFLRKQQDLSNRKFEENSSILQEFQTKNENLAANLAKVQKAFNGWFVNTDFMKFLETSIGVLAKWVNIPLSETMEKDRASMNLLFRQIVDVNTKTEDRIKLINEMKAIYPDLLGNINAETVTNDELSLSIKRVNDHLINKIILQQQDEEIAEQLEKAGKRKKAQVEAELKLMQDMQKVAEKYNLEIEQGIPLTEAAIKLANEAGTKKSVWELLNPKGSASALYDDVSALKGLISAAQKEEEGTNILLKEREEILERLGMKMNSDFISGAGQVGRAGALANSKPEAGNSGQPVGETPEEAAARKAQEKKAEDEYEKLVEKFKGFQEKLRDLRTEADLDRLDKDSRELAEIEAKFQAQRELALEYFNKGLLDQQGYDATIAGLNALQDEAQTSRIDSQNQALKDKRAAFREEVRMMSLDEEQREIEQAEQKFDALITQAEAYGLSTVELERLKHAAIEALTDAHDQKMLDKKKAADAKQLKQDQDIAEAKQMIAQGLSSVLGSSIDFIGNKQGELTQFQKALTGVQIAVDTASALAKIIPLAVDAAKTGGPAAPFLVAGYIATMAATVFGAAAKAKNALGEASMPEYNGDSQKAPTQGRPTTKAKKSFYFGGPTSDGIGFGDQYGEYAGYVHKHEYVIPQAVRQEPIVRMQIEPILESLRMKSMGGRSFFNGGETSPTPTSPAPVPVGNMQSDPEIKQLLRQLVTAQQQAQNKKVVLVSSDLEEHEAEKVMLQDRYSA